MIPTKITVGVIHGLRVGNRFWPTLNLPWFDLPIITYPPPGANITIRELTNPPPGANINAKDEVGKTALHAACREEKLEVIQYLIEHGAAINTMDKHGRTPLHLAAAMENYTVIRFVACTWLHVVTGTWLHMVTHGYTWLHMVTYNMVTHGYMHMVTHGYTWLPTHGCTWLHMVTHGYQHMVNSKYPLYCPCFSYLIEKKADYGAMTHGDIQTPLHYAAKNDAPAACKILVERGANLEAKDYRGRTPLLIAAELDRSVAASTLLDCGASAKVDMILKYIGC